ncbi:MAG: hypothetical protein AAGD86_08640 [Pseudomonadota bacterium]
MRTRLENANVVAAVGAAALAASASAAGLASEEAATPVPIAELTFTDAGLAACVEKHADKHGWSTADDVAELTCHNAGIASLDGLEALPRLKRASFFRNRVKRFSAASLPLIEHLNIAQNQLESFSLEQAPALKELYLFRNELTEFAASAMPMLTKLRISENQLAAVELANLPRLSRAYLHDNALEDIDLSVGLPALKFVDLRINPLPDPVYDVLDAMTGVTIPHDGNAEDWE